MSNHEELKEEIERENFIRSAAIAENLNLPEEEIKDLRYKAICQMAASRNSNGTKEIAGRYGFSHEEIRPILEDFNNKMKNEGNKKPLEPCYDPKTGKYLSFGDWIDYYIAK